MELVGRITKDAIVRTIKKTNRSVVSFTIAINDYYKPKDAEKGIKTTAYVECSYWMNPGITTYLTKGTLIEVQGRLYASAFTNKQGEAKATINCHVNSIKIHASINHTKTEHAEEKDLPF